MAANALALLPRAGLGNKLFPWARCVLFARNTGVRMAAPCWTQLKLGPFLRGERDPRLYVGQLRRVPEERGWPGTVAVRLCAPRLPEPPLDLPVSEVAVRGVYVFSGLADYFARLDSEGAWLRDSLERRLAPRFRRVLERFDERPFLGCHVRRGDFLIAERDGRRISRGAGGTPIWWFVEAVAKIRQAVGSVAVMVASDGSDSEVKELLALPGVARLDTGSAPSDLLALSGAAALLGSADSTFSGWASVLGSTPLATCPGRPFDRLGLLSRAGRSVGEFDPSVTSPAFETFLADLAARLRGRGWAR